MWTHHILGLICYIPHLMCQFLMPSKELWVGKMCSHWRAVGQLAILFLPDVTLILDLEWLDTFGCICLFRSVHWEERLCRVRQLVLWSKDLHWAQMRLLPCVSSSVAPGPPCMSGCSAECAAGMPLHLGSSESNWLMCSKAPWWSVRVGHWGDSLLIRKRELTETAHFCPLLVQCIALGLLQVTTVLHAVDQGLFLPKPLSCITFMSKHILFSSLSWRVACW